VFRRQSAVDREGAGSLDHQENRTGQCEQVILKAFSLLRSRPIHKKTKLSVNHRYRHQHVERDAERADAGEETDDQSQSTEELSSDSQKGKHGWNMHGSGEETHRPGKAIATKPSQHLLGSVSEEDDAKD